MHFSAFRSGFSCVSEDLLNQVLKKTTIKLKEYITKEGVTNEENNKLYFMHFITLSGITFLKKRNICIKYSKAHSKAPLVPTVIPKSIGLR